MGVRYKLAFQYDAKKSIACLAFCFIVAGVVGWAYEIVCGILNGEPINLLHGGLGIPFLTLYAAGAVIIQGVFGLGRPQQGPLAQIVLTGLLCTLVELATGEFMLHVIGVQTWTYLMPGWDFLASPDGIICLRASLTFGVFGLVLLRWVEPAFSRMWESDRRGVLVAITGVLCAVVVLALLNANVLHIVDVGTQWQ